jgi:multiple sugar transport system ATP-binding protein
MAEVVLDKVNKQYENGFHAVQDLDLDIADGEFLVLVGPSGCSIPRPARRFAADRTTTRDAAAGRLRLRRSARDGDTACHQPPRKGW